MYTSGALPSACKIHSGSNLPQINGQIMPLGALWQIDGLTICSRIKIERPIASGSSRLSLSNSGVSKMHCNALRGGGNSETGFLPIPMLTYGEILPHDNSLRNLIN